MSLFTTPSSAQHGPVADDNEVRTRLPVICVDYLSHEWQEEDVWKSWRSMTRKKNEIANGLRLENASWRTWWKQRNKLRTISPETLNWLKDSDVTWLYGPLHTAADPVPPPKIASTEDKLNLVNASGRKKPILKHRSISDMLTIPVAHSPLIELVSMDLDDSDENSDLHPSNPIRPPLWHTTSDSFVPRSRIRKAMPAPVDSPPSGIHSSDNNSTSSLDSRRRDSSSNSSSTSPPPDGTGSSVSGSSGRKHISFNTFVEQCIAIEAVPDHTPVKTIREEEEEEDDDDDALEMLSSVSSRSSRSSRSAMIRSMSTSDKDHFSIASIPPTLLKQVDHFPAPSPAVVFAPPHGSGYTAQTLSPSSELPPNRKRYTDFSSSGGAPSQWEEDDDDPLDYFGSPDLADGEQYNRRSRPSGGGIARSGSSSDLSSRGRFVMGSGSSGSSDGSRSRGRQSASPTETSPPTIVGASYRQSRGILKSSASSAPMNVPRPPPYVNDASTTSALARSSSLLSPPSSDPPSRGRSSSPIENGGRGRSAVRTSSSSLSDRESSRGTNSPIGSISPNSSRVSSAIINPTPIRRGSTSEVPNRSMLVRKVESPPSTTAVPSPPAFRIPVTTTARPGSNRVPIAGPKPPSIKTRGKGPPPSVVIKPGVGGGSEGGSSSPHSSKGFDFPSPPPLPDGQRRDEYWAGPMSASVSSNSSATATPTPATVRSTPTRTLPTTSPSKPTITSSPSTVSGLPTPQATPKRVLDAVGLEEEEYRSTNPTPVNSPISAFKMLASADGSSHMNGATSGQVQTFKAAQDGTLVSRAVDLVSSSAKGIFGALWNAGMGESVGRRSGSIEGR